MTEFNVQQKTTIDNYRTAKNLGFVLTDEAVAELIKKEIEQNGTIYPGFESLAKSVVKTKNEQTIQANPTPVKPNPSIFGSEIIYDNTDPFSIERKTQTNTEIPIPPAQNNAINFLKDLTNDAETTFKNRESESGVLSGVVNAWQEIFNKQYAKSTIKKELQTAKEDLRLLELASKGQLCYTDFLGDTHIRSFEDVFKQRRGTNFDEKAVADCSEKAKQFAAIKTSVEMINQTKQMLGYTTKGDITSQMNPQEASGSIIKAFQLAGINSLKEMNNTLKDIETKYKDHPDIQKYGGEFRFAKNKQGQYVIYRTAKNGYPAEATNEELKIIAKEMGLRLDKALATALGVEYSENATSEEMANLTQQTYDKYQKEYENSFAKAYGKKDVKALAETYVLKQQQGVANIEMGLNIASMALSVIPGGTVATSGWLLKGALAAKNTATGAKIVKGMQLVDKAKTFAKGAQTLQKVSKAATPFIMTNMTLRPTELLEQLTSKNGMSAEEWKAWGDGVLQNSIYMAAGMGTSKLAETGAAMYKTKALVHTLKSAGKSTDEIMTMIKANPVKFPNEIVKSLNKVDNLAKTLQVTSEVALDIGSTVLVNKALGNGDILTQDVINSIAFAISGGVLQKQFAPLSTDAKVSFIQNSLKEYGINKVEAERILKTMDDISAGKLRAKDIKPLDDYSQAPIPNKNNVTENHVNKNNNSDGTISTTSRLNYEVSRNINRGKRVVKYVGDKAVETYQGTKKVVKDFSKLIDTVSLDRKLKSFGIKNEYTREAVMEFFKKTPFESDKIYDELLKSIKIMKEMDISENDFQSILYHISNNNKKFDQSSLDIINELSNLHKLAGKSWEEHTANSLLFNGNNNTERLDYLKEFKASLDAGYAFKNIKYMLRAGIKGEDGRNAYKEILNSEFIQKIKEGLRAEYQASEYFKTCTDADGKFSHEYWEMLQNLDKTGIIQPENIFKILKNKNPDITKNNIETLITKISENPANVHQYSSSLIEKCITKDGRLDFSLMEDAQAVNKFGYNFDINLVKNKDGTFNKSAISTIQELQRNGFNEEDLNRIIDAAQKHSAIAEGELYSQEIIKKSIELKNAGVSPQHIGNMLNDCIEQGKLDTELLENIIPICKMLDTYSATETEFIIPLLKNYKGDTQKQTAAQLQKLMQNGFSTHDIAMSKIFNFNGSYGSITPDNIIDAAIQLKQAGYSWNIKGILAKSRLDDGTLNQESLNLIIDLKNKGISESYIDNILEIVTTEKGELLTENIETALSLLKEFKDSEFCNSIKDKNNNIQDGSFIINNTDTKSKYISEHGNNVTLVNTLIKMSSDEAGEINTEVLNANKAKLMSLYNKLEAEDKNMFVSYAQLAANKQGAFDENIFNKISELKYLDDGISDPNYHNTIKNFLNACKDENGNLDIQKYNDAIKLVKKHGFSKHSASYTIDLYEELKPYQSKNFVHDLSITEKRQLQSLLLSHSNNLKGLSQVKEILKADIIPTTDTGYSTLMKQLSQSLGDTDFVLDKPTLDDLHNNMTKLAQTLSTEKPIEQVSVNITYNDLLKRIKSNMSGLAESEKRKIYDYFGFNVKDGEILGFPSYLGKDIKSTDITDSFTQKVAQACSREIELFNKNNNITVKDNPELSLILTSISKAVPEVYNKFSSSEKSVQTLKMLKTITKDPIYTKLNDNEKQILILGTLLKDSNVGTTKETAFNIYNLSSKFNMSNTDRETLYKLLSMPDIITEYKNAKSVKASFNNRFGSPTVEYDKKELALDMLAFGMKDHKLDDLSYLLYSTGENKLITPELQTELKQRIFEIKSDDFILPQTHTQAIKDHTTTQTINGYKVQVANASEIPNFYAYVHTPDAGAVNNSSRITKFSNFEEFQNIDSDAVICTSYISADKSATWLDNGFIFEVGTGNEYVGMGHDMFSLGKNKSQVVAEYYRNKGLKALSGKGYKYSHRSFISSHLKDILHITENSYSDLIANKRKLNSELEKLSPNSTEALDIQAKITKIDSEIQKINEDYVARMDKIKSQIHSKQFNLEEIRSIDPELASAYEQFLARDNTGHKFGKEALMRNDYWNEVLISNPQISAIYTKDISKIPKEYLEKAQNEGIPIVIIQKHNNKKT